MVPEQVGVAWQDPRDGHKRRKGVRGADRAGGGVPRRRGSRGASGAEAGRLRGCEFRRGFTGAARPGYIKPSYTKLKETERRLVALSLEGAFGFVVAGARRPGQHSREPLRRSDRGRGGRGKGFAGTRFGLRLPGRRAPATPNQVTPNQVTPNRGTPNRVTPKRRRRAGTRFAEPRGCLWVRSSRGVSPR